MRHMVHYIIDITSLTGTNMSGSSSTLLPNKEFHTKASGQIGSKAAVWIFLWESLTQKFFHKLIYWWYLARRQIWLWMVFN